MNTYKNWKIVRDEDNIVWLHFDKAESSVNLLSGAVLEELSGILDELATDLPTGVIILSDKKDSFIFGADIKEFTTLESGEEAQAFLNRGHALMNKLEALKCTTVSMVHGICLGGGTELSLACDYIITSDDSKTKLGLPEIKLGIFPGYGGTVRSIKRCGPMAAMGFMLTGRVMAARVCKKLGLVDEVVPLRQLKAAAVKFVKTKPKHKKLGLVARLANTSLARPIVASQMRKQVAKKAKEEHYPAPYKLISLWQKYAGDSKRMLKEEAKTVAKLATTATARNLVRVFFLQEKLKANGKQIDFKAQHIHVIGGGLMGGDIASWCAIQGYNVSVQDQNPEQLAKTMKRAHSSFKRKFKRDHRSIRDACDRLIPDHKGDGVSKADIIIEAIFEDAEVKRNVYTDIEPRMKDDAILATNTSSLKLEDLQDCLKKPERLVGLHFFNPVAMMPLVEVVRGEKTDDIVMQKSLAFARDIGKLPLPTKSSPGFLVNRILVPGMLEAVRLYEEGVQKELIDKASLNMGMPMGAIELVDTIGVDVCHYISEIMKVTLGFESLDTLRDFTKSGKHGKKTGEGFYIYKKGKPVKNTISTTKGIDDIENRIKMRFINEVLACYREGVVDGDDMIDAGFIFGTGIAPYNGGILTYIHDTGVDSLKQIQDALYATYGDRFKPDSQWDKL